MLPLLVITYLLVITNKNGCKNIKLFFFKDHKYLDNEKYFWNKL